MKTWKITNITPTLNKRVAKYNSTINIEYVDDMEKKSFSIKPNEVALFSASSLPISLHRYSMENIITIVEIGEKALGDIIKSGNVIKPKKKKPVETTTTTKKLKSGRKLKQKTTIPSKSITTKTATISVEKPSTSE
jgi:hypothetical protein